MTIFIKTSSDIEKMRISGKIASEVLNMIESYIKPGISTGEIDRICNDYVRSQKAISASLDYHGFPKSVCVSVNDVVCHGIPSNHVILCDGDIVNVDVAIIKDGLYADTSKMFFVGKPSILAQRLCDVTQKSLYLAISMVRPGVHLRKLGRAIQQFVEKKKFTVVREYCGHGIGKNFHEAPHVFHYDTNQDNVVLRAGMALTIEPMVNAGSASIYTMEDGWTVKTRDHSLSAQYEHTIIITQDGCEIITWRFDDVLPKEISHK